MKPRLGLIGVGEAGSAIAAGLRDGPGVPVTGFDSGPRAITQRRADEAGIQLVDSLDDLARCSDIILCLAVSSAATAIAEAIAPVLRAEHIYADCNSAGPRRKRDVARIVEATGASFIDVAVMAAVLPHRHKVPLLLSGRRAEALAAALTDYDMNVEVLGPEPGQASAVKILRSLVVKGVEALLLECAIGAERFGVTERVFGSLAGTLPDDWTAAASYLLGRSLAHGARRADELRQAADTLRDAGIAPLLAEASAARLQWLVDLGPLDIAAEADYRTRIDAILSKAVPPA
jgi:3-hydroxyisobutyrate dehydrogenase-like beta-hydroxyacid dehydrogenase